MPEAKVRLGEGSKAMSEAAIRGRGRPKLMSDQEQGIQILAGARALLMEKGYDGTTMDDVAARCHCSKRTLYRLFPSKTALFSAIVDVHRQTMLALPGDYRHLPLAEALAAIFRVDITPEADRERQAVLHFMLGEGRHHPELREALMDRGPARARALLADWLTGEAQAGRLRLEDAPTTAQMLMDVLLGSGAPHSPARSLWTDAEGRRLYQRRAIRVLVEGLAPRG